MLGLKKRKVPPSMPDALEIEGLDTVITIKRSKRAKRLSLRLDTSSGEIVMTLPPRTSMQKAKSFAKTHQDWIAKQITELPDGIAFADGSLIPILGTDHQIRHVEGKIRGLVRCENKTLFVPGLIEHLPRRVEDFLRQMARDEITPKAHAKAAQIGKTIKRIRIADQKTRWGSCSRTGTLSFSWRLIFAPEDVLDYVIAHEVAHMQHMDHSKAFWKLCDTLCDDHNAHDGRRWLRDHGNTLMRYGR